MLYPISKLPVVSRGKHHRSQTDLFQPPWANDHHQSVLTTWKLKTIQNNSSRVWIHSKDLRLGLKLGSFSKRKLSWKYSHNTSCPHSMFTFSTIGTIKQSSCKDFIRTHNEPDSASPWWRLEDFKGAHLSLLWVSKTFIIKVNLSHIKCLGNN